ncbi:MAG: response regulator [Desulfoplanes sp.]|nr:response regulator [Desulfoplanes sp.]
MATNTQITENYAVKILIVDDKQANLLAMGELLKNPGYEITKVDSGESALRCILKNEFAVILLDVQMPGLDGFETAALIRQREKSRNTPIIFITAAGKNHELMEKGYALGAVDYIFKPIEPSFLKTKVSVFVELHRRAVEAKKLTQSNQELEQFAYIASHDLQEPLRKIRSFSELLAKRYKGQLDSDADDFIYYITDGVTRMQRLIEGLLTFSRVTTQGNPLIETNFNHLIKETLAMIDIKIKETGSKITVGPLPVLKVDPGQMMQVFQNLILNAIKFKGQDDPVIHIKAEKKSVQGQDGWQFAVIDNGIGINLSQKDRIFKIFQRLHLRNEYPGEGMGLAISKKIIERHQGRIWIDSPGEGKGSTLLFFLPCQDASQEQCQE